MRGFAFLGQRRPARGRDASTRRARHLSPNSTRPQQHAGQRGLTVWAIYTRQHGQAQAHEPALRVPVLSSRFHDCSPGRMAVAHALHLPRLQERVGDDAARAHHAGRSLMFLHAFTITVSAPEDLSEEEVRGRLLVAVLRETARMAKHLPPEEQDEVGCAVEAVKLPAEFTEH